MKAKWTYATYDVWGNAEDGYEINNVFRGGPNPQEFEADMDNDTEFLNACIDYLGIVHDVEMKNLTIDGDDIAIYVESAEDGYPLGEFHKVEE